MNYCLVCTIFLLTITSFSSAQLHLSRLSANEKHILNTQSDTTYDLIIGETYQCVVPAHGWRRDTTILSDHSRWYKNPFVNGNRIEVFTQNNNAPMYYYNRGFLFTGTLRDTIWISTGTEATLRDIVLHPHEPAAIFTAQCTRGLVHGVGQLIALPSGKLLDQKLFQQGKYEGEYTPLEEHDK